MFFSFPGRKKDIRILLATVCLIMAGCATTSERQVTVGELEKKAHAARMRGDLPGAEKAYEKALSLDGNDPEVLNNLAVILDRMGQRKRALDCLRKGAGIRPDDPRILLNWARLELEEGNDEKALELSRRIRSMEKWPEGFRTLMGKIDIDLARYPEAHLYLHEAFERHPGNPLVLTYLGIVHFRIGETAQSKKDFRNALRMHPSEGLRRSLLFLLRNPQTALGGSAGKNPVGGGSISGGSPKR